MYRSLLQTLALASTWATASASYPPTFTQQIQNFIQTVFTGHTQIYLPGTTQFEDATLRWSTLDQPKPSIVIAPATEADVLRVIRFANLFNIPYLAYNGVHAAMTTLGGLTWGIDISLSQLSSVEIAADGQTATIGGGTRSKFVTDTLWAAGKQTVTGACECVSYMGPALGGGHGWLQGHHGLVSDQILSMNVALANGSLVTIDDSSELMWAMKGAGANFGIVTSVTAKVYDVVAPNWAGETIIFSGDAVQSVYETANEVIIQNGTQPADLANWSYWLNIPEIDPNNPVIIFYILQEGVDTVDSAYTQPFHDIGTLSVTAHQGTYLDLANWTDVAIDSPPCQLTPGVSLPRFPIYLQEYNTTAMQQAYDLYATNIGGSSSPFTNSIFMFESYSWAGVRSFSENATAFAFRNDHLLIAPLINYMGTGNSTLDDQVKQLGDDLRQTLLDGSGNPELHAYVNYAYGDETDEGWYGHEEWRQTRLHSLKSQYDPHGDFSYFAPIN